MVAFNHKAAIYWRYGSSPKREASKKKVLMCDGDGLFGYRSWLFHELSAPDSRDSPIMGIWEKDCCSK